MKYPPRPPSAHELQQGKLRLKTVGSTHLGPLDVSNATFKRSSRDTPHGFADAVSAQRRGVTELRAHLNENGGVTGPAATYARDSMNEWARRAHNTVSGLTPSMQRRYGADATRLLYDNWRADSPQSRKGAADTLVELVEASNNTPRTGVKVYDQSSKLDPMSVLLQQGGAKAMGKFAYRMNPVQSRPSFVTGEVSRLSLNLDASEAPQMVKRMVDVVQTHPDSVRQSKIMGPGNIGKRVDDAVVYLGMNRPTVAEGQRIDQALSHGFQGPQARATPPGMEPLSPISAYAEYMPGTSSSHGNNRGAFVEQVIDQKSRGQQAPVGELMSRALQQGGYDPQQPSRISLQQTLKNAMAARRKGMGYDT